MTAPRPAQRQRSFCHHSLSPCLSRPRLSHFSVRCTKGALDMKLSLRDAPLPTDVYSTSLRVSAAIVWRPIRRVIAEPGLIDGPEDDCHRPPWTKIGWRRLEPPLDRLGRPRRGASADCTDQVPFRRRRLLCGAKPPPPRPVRRFCPASCPRVQKARWQVVSWFPAAAAVF